MSISLTSGKTLGLFTLVMINVIAIDNLRSLTVGAEFGFSLFFFYLLAALLFFIPTILVTAELATGWPNTGGVYIWVREAFGPQWGFLTIWLQWIYNVVWYPTIFAFVAGVVAYLINPQWTQNTFFMLSMILVAFWVTTIINCLGLKISSIVSIVGAIIGTIFPMTMIAIMGLTWVYLGKTTQIPLNISHFFPHHMHWGELAFLTNILFGLMGMEMSAVHAGDVRDPARNYPRALVYSAVIILMTLIFACLAITIVIPLNQLNLVSGLMDAFGVFFKAYHMQWFIPIIGLLIIVGSMSSATAWILGPARGLLVASEEAQLPSFLTRRNSKNMPVGILCIQGLIVTFLCSVFLMMPSVNSSYWVLSNLTAQLALLFYILMFAAAIRLRHKHSHVKRAYHIPGGLVGTIFVCSVGIVTCLFAIIIGFVPPTQIAIGNKIIYEGILIGGIVIFCLPPFILTAIKSRQKIRK
jgi:amino acid transporter